MNGREFAAIIGIDLSLNHAGIVELDAVGHMTWFGYVTDTKAAAAQHPNGVHLPGRAKGADPQQFHLERLTWWDGHMRGLFAGRSPTHVGIEDYAFAGAQSMAQATGEQGGIVRLLALSFGARLRLHDPTTVKMFAAHNGHATAWEVVTAVRERWGANFSAYNPPPPKNAKQKPNTLVEEDLAAAYTVARLLWTETELRAGRLQLAELHEKEVQVFQRATKAQPVSLLGREWLEVRPTA